MLLNDYLMRLIHRFTEGMARVAHRRNLGDHPGALREIGEVANDVFGLAPHALKEPGEISEAELRSALRAGKEKDPKKMLMMAELLEVRGEVFEEVGAESESEVEAEADADADSEERKGEEQAMADGWSLALRLCAEALTASRELRTDENGESLERLRKRLEDFQLPPATLVALVDYFQRVGRFSEAEDALYELLDIDERQGIKRGRAFYETLSERSDEDLNVGGLPREEVEDGLQMVEEREVAPAP